jgi:hypothetical protein
VSPKFLDVASAELVEAVGFVSEPLLPDGRLQARPLPMGRGKLADGTIVPRRLTLPRWGSMGTMAPTGR